MSDKMDKWSDIIPHDRKPTFEQLVSIIEKNFKDYLEFTKAFTAEEIENGWQRYKVLNHLYQDESIWVKANIKPPFNEGVLVFIPGEDNHITAGMWDIDMKWVLLDEYRTPECEVTHWMELPPIPAEYECKELPEEITKALQEIAEKELPKELKMDSIFMVGRVKDRFKELEAKGWDWRSFYNGWLEGRADMFAQVKGIGKYNELGKEEAVTMNQRIAQQILKVRDAIVAGDMDLAYHELYKIASPNFDKMSDEVWAGIEKAALQPTIEIDLAAAMEEGAELWKMEYDACRSILTELVDLKNIKDLEGKTDDYNLRQPIAWVRAKRFLEKYQHINW